ncbi:tRNA (N6-isopentenyl adenosine(37)-C2)-methylthiotransferase MiaB [Candidatus Aquarickettsia rohweri]|uniref:tRNA-2-methylthio-N(6)-dimethylallyladenosine synthase n=1 Tax=Candidatus Aquarickettsia rohweri TaxID=2602574 RepID=A0A429XW78_9RICK|nr:tRNA (N6-isopentenyl adenosine(37)-C2)-methylthiotransferase MiaB [Candidatus Aquarickettsia rohweri]RST72640.1 tRNA (N6-isopentenyl adenosine(37)-C2)-methylthiotransferase MiaB [Candidatus Aquarickettsia rohweri]
MQNKNLYIKTYGCQMNVYDSLKMGNLLKPHGFSITNDEKNADLIILNTCHIREKASEKVYSELGKIKENNFGIKPTVVVAGCTAQAEGEQIFKRAKNVDIVVGPQSYHNLPKLLERVKRQEKLVIDLDFDEENKFDKIEIPDNPRHSSFLTIQEGCDKFCHFCCVPYTRGKEYSRKIPDIYREALSLVSKGVKEITLLGQNVSAYHGLDDQKNQKGLGWLLKQICKINGLERVRYTTSHPKDMIEDDLFIAHAEEEKLMPFLHLPVQSGSDSILKSMNRNHNRDFYFKVIDKFRKFRPDIAFSSDFIVGYPGETDQDFQDTLDLVRKVKYAQCYSFKYSPRPGTPASMLENQVPEEVKSERLTILQSLLREQQLEFNKGFIGKDMDVMFEKKGKHEGQFIGKSPYLQSVVVKTDANIIGEIKKVTINRAGLNSLNGELVIQ